MSAPDRRDPEIRLLLLAPPRAATLPTPQRISPTPSSPAPRFSRSSTGSSTRGTLSLALLDVPRLPSILLADDPLHWPEKPTNAALLRHWHFFRITTLGAILVLFFVSCPLSFVGWFLFAVPRIVICSSSQKKKIKATESAPCVEEPVDDQLDLGA